jgi:hypothetical protein
MSNIKFSENLFLEVAEFNRFQKFLENDGFKRHFLLNTDSFGIIRQANLPEIGNVNVEDNFYVSKAGTPFNEVVVNKGFAIDSNGDLILNSKNVNIAIPNDNLWYWVKIAHKYSSVEKGTLSIDILGNVTGVGTEFTKILRGQPNFPSKIKFTNSINGNADEYEVVKVVDDNNLIIQGDFTSETNLKYEVIGTFTPGFVVNDSNKKIFRYDSVEISLVKETTLNEQPTFIPNKEFFIARVRNSGVNLSLQDKRINWWQSEAMSSLTNLDRNSYNPLIGVENVKWDIKTSTRAKSWVEMAWGFRFESWTVDTSSKRVSILIGQGGVYKDTSYFQNLDFNGWRLYAKNGSYQNIIDSIKTGTQIVITLDVLNINDYVSGDLLFIAPPYEEIEVRIRKNDLILDTDDINANSITNEPFPYPNIEEIHNFSINTPLARFQVPSQKNCYDYNVTFRYKIFNDYSNWQALPNDIVGYYKEKSFDDYGNLNPNPIDRERKPYVGHPDNGFITICEHKYSFDNFQEFINIGDLFGVNTTQFSNSEPLVNLRVSESKKYQHFKGNNNTFVLNSDIYINLDSFKDAAKTKPCREGNTFFIHIEQFLDLSTFKLRIVENYLNPTSWNLVTEIDANDVAYIKNNTKYNSATNQKVKGLFITCTFNDLGKWICHYDTDETVKGTVKMLNNVNVLSFDTLGFGRLPGYFGYKIIAQDGIFPMLTSNVTQVGVIAGENQKSITEAMLPEHDHKVSGRSADRNTSGNGYSINQVHKGAYSATDSAQTTTSKAGGSAAPVKLDITPRHIKLLFVEKIV